MHFSGLPLLKACPLLLVAALTALPASAEILPPMAITGTVGLQTSPSFKGTGFGFDLSAYEKFDEQVLLGVQTGQGIAGYPSSIPVLAAGFMRLPFGRIIVPVATGGLGYAFGSNGGSGFVWRGGGAFDIRNGRRSSLLLGCAYEGFKQQGGIVVRGGALLEF